MIVRRRIKRKEGDIVAIPLSNSIYGFGVVLPEPLLAFLNIKSKTLDFPEKISDTDSLFKIWVFNDAVTSGRWPVVGHIELGDELLNSPEFFKQDPITGELSIYSNGVERTAKKHECVDLECAAVWEPEHVEDRLRDYFNGNENRWVNSLKIV